jgi:uncharacterized membrane-anchored protein
MNHSASAAPASNGHTAATLPPDDAARAVLHNEVHARPPARIRLPALVVYVAVLNEGVSRDQEFCHLRRLPGHSDLQPASEANFLQLHLADHSVRWERHGEFTRYSVVQQLQAPAPGGETTDPCGQLAVDGAWLRQIPGRTFCAIELLMLESGPWNAQQALDACRRWFGERTVLASQLGLGHSCAVTDFQIQDNGFERIVVMAAPDTSASRAGRISQRLLEVETYRLMALRGLPVAKALGPMLREAESALADITGALEDGRASDASLLETLIALAARVERATAEHGYRFAATQAYETLVNARIEELREVSIPGTQTIGEFMRRRLSPAIATVRATAQRLGSLSQRIERASALLRTRVDIAAEGQNQLLLAKLTRGQELQLRLQSTVEGLSIAAIAYYVVNLLLYLVKAAKAAGAPVNPELAAGAMVPLVVWGAWWTIRRIHARLHETP